MLPWTLTYIIWFQFGIPHVLNASHNLLLCSIIVCLAKTKVKAILRFIYILSPQPENWWQSVDLFKYYHFYSLLRSSKEALAWWNWETRGVEWFMVLRYFPITELAGGCSAGREFRLGAFRSCQSPSIKGEALSWSNINITAGTFSKTGFSWLPQLSFCHARCEFIRTMWVGFTIINTKDPMTITFCSRNIKQILFL